MEHVVVVVVMVVVVEEQSGAVKRPRRDSNIAAPSATAELHPDVCPPWDSLTPHTSVVTSHLRLLRLHHTLPHLCCLCLDSLSTLQPACLCCAVEWSAEDEAPEAVEREGWTVCPVSTTALRLPLRHLLRQCAPLHLCTAASRLLFRASSCIRSFSSLVSFSPSAHFLGPVSASPRAALRLPRSEGRHQSMGEGGRRVRRVTAAQLCHVIAAELSVCGCCYGRLCAL